jgi:NADH/NAD ratio-sensing transcriptional regulator Rex
VVLTAPKGVTVRNVDLGVELQILGYHEQIRSQGATQPARVTV